MAFNFFKWLLGDSGGNSKAVAVSEKDFLDAPDSGPVVGIESYLQRMAFWGAVRKIGAALGAIEWETYRRRKKVKAKEYWSWNYSPNPNQNRSEFFMSLAAELFLRQKCVIVELPTGARYVADGYTVEERLSGDIYRDITSRGESIPGTFSSRDVLVLTIEGDSIRTILGAIAEADGALLKSSTNNYVRSAGRHGVLNIDEIAEADPDFDETYTDLVNEKFKKYFQSENAVLPLFKGYSYDEKSSSSSARTQATTRDIRALMDDIIEFTAQAVGIPPSICTGKSVTDADFSTFMTSTVQPLATMIAGEINRKLYGQQLVFSGTYITPNLGGVRYRDVFDIADPIDKLIGSGAFCVNDIRLRLGLDTIDADWANQHFMTKNYSAVEDLVTGVDAGASGPGGLVNNNPAPTPEKGENEEND